MFALTGNSDINTSLQERFAGASPGETSLQDARILKPLKLDDQRRVQEGLTEVEAERQNSAVRQISYGMRRLPYLQCKSLTEQCALFPSSKLFLSMICYLSFRRTCEAQDTSHTLEKPLV